MKKLILLVTILLSCVAYSQTNKPLLESEGNLVKATYSHENGTVQQVGFFKDGKLDGTWTSYDENGNVSVVAQYLNGVKIGTWKYFDKNVCLNEVRYSDNRIVDVKKLNQYPIADKN